jgi:CheY-like chemotaxis protein
LPCSQTGLRLKILKRKEEGKNWQGLNMYEGGLLLGVKLGMNMANVMIVDDDEKLRWVLRAILEREGYQVTEAESGNKCLEMLSQGEKPDVILLDVMMPGLNGWETCRKIKGDPETQDIIVTMLTLNDKLDDMIKSLNFAAADWHIAKPMEKAIILDTLDWILKTKNSRGEVLS